MEPKVRGAFCHYDGKALGDAWVELVTRVEHGEGGNGGVRARTILPFCTEECAQAHLVVEFPYPVEKVAKEAVAMLHRELQKEREDRRVPPSWDFIERVHGRLETLVQEAEKVRAGHAPGEEQRRVVKLVLGSMYRVEPASVDPEAPVVLSCGTCGACPIETTPHKVTCLVGKLEAAFGPTDFEEVCQALWDGGLRPTEEKEPDPRPDTELGEKHIGG